MVPTMRTASGKNGVVSSAHPVATRAGLRVLKKGGNAVDAAIATALTLGVVAPAWSGIGGGGFALIHMAQSDETVAVDYREVAPINSDAGMFRLKESGEVENKANAIGPLAVAVPGIVSGIETVLDRYATMNFRDICKFTQVQAAAGTAVAPALGLIMRENRDDVLEKFRRFEPTGQVFLRRKKPLRIGQKFAIPNLAKTLTAIMSEGRQAFYEGRISENIIGYLRKSGGIFTQDDFAQYSTRIRTPVRSTYRGYEICGMPPPSSGGLTIIEILNIIEGFDFSKIEHYSPQAVHIIAEAMSLAYHDRTAHIADPDFVTVPVSELSSKKHAEELRSKIVTSRTDYGIDRRASPVHEGTNTTHLTVLDKEGNVAALTESIECYFGSGILVPEVGVILNDEMHDFDPRPDRLNSVAPKKRPLSSMAPTILFRDGRPQMALGSAGGLRIISSVAQTIINIVEFGMTLPEAVTAPRFHRQADKIILEKEMRPAELAALTKLGHSVEIKRGPDLFYGGVHAVGFDPIKRKCIGTADPRRDGIALAF